MPLWTKQRPPGFRLTPDQTHLLRRGLLFAMLGQHPKSFRAHDTSLFGNHGTLTNMDPATDWVWGDGVGWWMVDFDATSTQYIALPVLPITSDFTMSAWYDLDPVEGTYNTIFGAEETEPARNVPLRLRLISLTYTVVYVIFSDYSSVSWSYSPTGAMFHGRHHIAITKKGTSYTLYLDGASLGVRTSSSTINWSKSINIGAHRRSSPVYGFNGLIGDAAIYNASTSVEIISTFADPSNTLLSIGNQPLILPDEPTVFPVAVATPPVVTYRPMQFQVC